MDWFIAGLIVLIIGSAADRRKRRRAAQAEQAAIIRDQKRAAEVRLKLFGPEDSVVKVSYPNPATSDKADIQEFLDNEDRYFILKHYLEDAEKRNAPRYVLAMIKKRISDVINDL